MSKVIKTIFLMIIISALFTLISSQIPNPVTTTINNAFVYFLSYINYLNVILDVSAIFICMKILANFIVSVLYFLAVHWIYKHFIHD